MCSASTAQRAPARTTCLQCGVVSLSVLPSRPVGPCRCRLCCAAGNFAYDACCAMPQERAPIAVFKEDDVAFVDELVQRVTAWLQVGRRAGSSAVQGRRHVQNPRCSPRLATSSPMRPTLLQGSDPRLELPAVNSYLRRLQHEYLGRDLFGQTGEGPGFYVQVRWSLSW